MKLNASLKYIIQLIGISILVGIIVGIIANSLGFIFRLVEELFLKFHESPSNTVNLLVSPLRKALSVFSASIIVSIVWYVLHKESYLTNVEEALRGKKMSSKATIISGIAQTLYIGAGGSIGRESAPREIGAFVAQKFGYIFNFNKDDLKILIASAAGAGLAGQYTAPLSGIVFANIILYKKITVKSLAISSIMSMIATLIGVLDRGTKAYYLIDQSGFSLRTIPFAIISGLVIGILGHYYRQLISKAKSERITNERIFLLLPLIGFLTGLIIFINPFIMGNGRALAQFSYSITSPSKALAIFLIFSAIIKAIITSLNIYAGAYGGILTPSISIGGALGLLIGFVWSCFVDPSLPLIECGLIGSAAFLAATQKSYIFSCVLILELCHLNFLSLAPLIIAGIVAIQVPKMLVLKKKLFQLY